MLKARIFGARRETIQSTLAQPMLAELLTQKKFEQLLLFCHK